MKVPFLSPFESIRKKRKKKTYPLKTDPYINLVCGSAVSIVKSVLFYCQVDTDVCFQRYIANYSLFKQLWFIFSGIKFYM